MALHVALILQAMEVVVGRGGCQGIFTPIPGYTYFGGLRLPTIASVAEGPCRVGYGRFPCYRTEPGRRGVGIEQPEISSLIVTQVKV